MGLEYGAGVIILYLADSLRRRNAKNKGIYKSKGKHTFASKTEENIRGKSRLDEGP